MRYGSAVPCKHPNEAWALQILEEKDMEEIRKSKVFPKVLIISTMQSLHHPQRGEG